MVWKRYGQTGALENINRWFGHGPYRVWKSRLQGLAYKNPQSYRPELGIPGIQRLPPDHCWAQPETREQPINLVSAHEGTVLYLYTPHFPEDATLAAARLSAGDISLFEGMAAHRYQIPQRRTVIRWTTNKVRLLEHWYQRDVFRS